MRTTVAEARARFFDLPYRAEAGELTRDGRLVARLVWPRLRRPLIGALKGHVAITAALDDLPPDVLAASRAPPEPAESEGGAG